MNLDHLRYFAAVVEHDNVTRAAELLHVSQPTVSAALQSLERELGRPLFERSGRRLHLTTSGADTYRRVVRILNEWEEARADGRATTGVKLRLGVLQTLPHRCVSDLADLLHHEKSQIALTLRSATLPRLTAWLANHRIDAALTCVDASTPNVRVLRKEPYVAMFHPDHRLARRHSLMMADLHGERFVQRSHCEYLASGGEKLQHAGVKLNLVARADSDDLALALVEHGFGFTLAPLSLGTPRIRAVPVDDFTIHRSVGLQIGDTVTPDTANGLERALHVLRLTNDARATGYPRSDLEADQTA